MDHNPYAPPTATPHHQPSAPGIEPPSTVSVVDSIKFGLSSQVGFRNLAFGLLLLILPLVGPVLLGGWMAESHRRLVSRKGPAVLDFSFDRFMSYLMAGIVPFVAQMGAAFVIAIPASVVMGGFVGVAVALFDGGGEPGGALVAMFALAAFGAMFVMMVVATVVVTSLTIRAELTGDFNKTFDFKEVSAFIKRQWLPILGHHLLLGLLSMPLIFGGMLVFFVGMYFVAVALQFAQMHLRWQIFEADLRMGGAALPVFEGDGANL